ncbi:Uncharacterised protein [uncultured Clostridium sp.]|uniref:DUF3784 domain-containing protein n=1 Tax=Paeniclostridium hominis TaxID=2764329 RepID=A0ABR7K1H0_9FIRM|nr:MULTISPECIES: hypothetical protein [Paeniclostridium]MBC6002950.1 hypothetical protein [Paeniclostridium hominis]MBC8630162.1 hypothetical protein [[Eubacterium] tenue]SCI87325.1 Uncharacterised protein [uncultured Clostridium sp.]SCJ00424.1 Uncharacterised protein [uncultured Clostridium sp.]
MLKFIICIIISIIILSMAYSIGIKKRLNLISLVDENKLKNKTKKEINKASIIMGMGYLNIFILFMIMNLSYKFSLIAFTLLILDIFCMFIYIYKMF